MFVCKICGQALGAKGISSHLRRKHNGLDSKTYYDLYLKQDGEGFCKICGKPTKYDTILTGYRQYCSTKCLNLDPIIRAKIEETSLKRYGVKCNLNLEETKEKAKSNSHTEEAETKRADTNIQKYGAKNVFGSTQIQEKIKQVNLQRYGVEYTGQSSIIKQHISETHQKRYGGHFMKNRKCLKQVKKKRISAIKQFEIDNDCTSKLTIEKQYGAGWYIEGILKDRYLRYRGMLFIKNEDIPVIKQYVEELHTYTSRTEKELVSFIGSFYSGEIIENTRKLIHPYEVDIFIPALNLGIEYNGTFWHSLEHGFQKNYHLQKSLRCREKGIRLIHIYEFEDFEQQKQLLKDLIDGKDNYPPQDFNKNNLLDFIPRPCIIYKKDYTVYGAGKLY